MSSSTAGTYDGAVYVEAETGGTIPVYDAEEWEALRAISN